jgi:hypothetical protein
MDAVDYDADDIRHDRDFQRRLDAFNLAEWCVACRKMQVLLTRGEADHARKILDEYIARELPHGLTWTSHVSMAFTERNAKVLIDAGYETLGALRGASDQDLLEVFDIGEKMLEAVRAVVRAVERGKRVELVPDEVGYLIDWRLIGATEDS